jgi:alkaline phosphatase D
MVPSMKTQWAFLMAAVLGFSVSVAGAGQKPVNIVAFGSCANQNKPQAIWSSIQAAKPDLFLWLGDNIYANTEDPAVFDEKYAMLATQPGYAAFRPTATIMATWDDHDYGVNDGGAEYPMRQMAAEKFKKFFGTANGPAWPAEGVYSSAIFGPEGQRVQVILLDTRYFRTALEKDPDSKSYLPSEGPDATILGETQWQWLEGELLKPAEVRLIGSSIQFVAAQHRFEKWANFPREKQRLLDGIRKTSAKGVIFLSGDRHLAEISVLPAAQGVGYPLYDITSSGLTNAGGRADEPNNFRLGENFRSQNFGLLTIDWSATPPIITIEIRDIEGKVALTETVPLSNLAP